MRLIRALLVLLVLAPCARAERLPVQAYTTADGLARDQVLRIVSDSRSFLWFGTSEGLSRFDGLSFTSYGAADGLEGNEVADILETKAGVRLFATNRGLFRLEDSTAARTRFVSALGDDRRRVTALLETADGSIVVAHEAGVARLRDDRLEPLVLPQRTESEPRLLVDALAESPAGTLWAATNVGLFRSVGGAPFEPVASAPPGEFRALLAMPDGSLWAGFADGLAVLAPQAASFRVLSARESASAREVTSLCLASDGTLWAGMLHGILERQPGAAAFVSHGLEDGLADDTIYDVTEDASGNIWLATESGGALRLPRHGLVTYTEADGLGHSRIAQLIDDASGRLVAVDTLGYLDVLEGHRFTAVRPNFAAPSPERTWGWSQLVLHDSRGEWWYPTAAGLFRFPRTSRVEDLATATPIARYGTAEGLAGNDVFRTYEDASGTIWVASFRTDDAGLARFDRDTNRFVSVPLDPVRPRNIATAFAEDGDGNLWIGLFDGTLLRTRAGKDAQVIAPPGAEKGLLRDLLLDSHGRLWAAAENAGVLRIDAPGSPAPEVVRMGRAEGLASTDASCLVEDADGRIWIGTGRGLDRLDPQSGRIEHFTTADGLANNFVNVAHRDAQGTLWFGTLRGLSRLEAVASRPAPPPRTWITGLSVAGRAWPVSDLGEAEVKDVKLAADERRLAISFLAVSLAPGEALRYQWKLEGADADWTLPSTQREVTYDQLPSGRHAFLVRAVDARGASADPPARVSFRVARPLWLSWWVLLLVAAAVGGCAFVVYRWRVERLLELERIRTRIASDLHDDIGAGLTQVSILSEVARQRAKNAPPQVIETLERIALVSRELVDSMSDIVWAVDPRRDSLGDLMHRMRRFASDVLASRTVDFRFESATGDDDLRLTADLRRQVFLIYKEAVNNVARHSECSFVRIRVEKQSNPPALRLAIEDDGVGFELSDEITGLGLGSLVTRARKLGGELDVESAEGKGTRVTLTVPLPRRRGWSWP